MTIESTTESMQSLATFLSDTREQDESGETFVNESARTLRIELNGGVWLKPGAAIAYRGDIAFERRHTTDAGSISDAVLRETAPLVGARGKGRLYCGHHGAHVRVVKLTGERVVVSWQDLLAFEESLTFDLALVGHGIGILAGGLVVATLAGNGAFALITHGQPLTLPVLPGEPVCTDPRATLAWSADLTPTLKMDVSWRSALAHGGAEPVQMCFDGTGFVVVQPYEDRSRIQIRANPLKRVASLIG